MAGKWGLSSAAVNVAEGRKLLGLTYQVVWGGMSKTLAHVLFLRADGVCWILCDVFRVLLVGTGHTRQSPPLGYTRHLHRRNSTARLPTRRTPDNYDAV